MDDDHRAGNAARESHDDEIDARHIQAGISADNELVQVKDNCRLFSSWKRKQREEQRELRPAAAADSAVEEAAGEAEEGPRRKRSRGGELVVDEAAAGLAEPVAEEDGDGEGMGEDVSPRWLDAERLTKTAVRLAAGNDDDGAAKMRFQALVATKGADQSESAAAAADSPGAASCSFDPSVVARRLAEHIATATTASAAGGVSTTDSAAPIYMAAVMEYLTAEMLGAAGNAARQQADGKIDAKHIQMGMASHTELNQVKDACGLYASWKRKQLIEEEEAGSRQPASGSGGGGSDAGAV